MTIYASDNAPVVHLVKLGQEAVRIVAIYDRSIRENRGPTWDTLAAVADCDDGWMGAWGEVLEAADHNGYPLEFEDGSIAWDGPAYDVLQVAYQAWLIALRAQVAAEAAHRAWKEQT